MQLLTYTARRMLRRKTIINVVLFDSGSFHAGWDWEARPAACALVRLPTPSVQIISRRGHDHHRPPLAPHAEGRHGRTAARKVANCYAGFRAPLPIKGQVVARSRPPITVFDYATLLTFAAEQKCSISYVSAIRPISWSLSALSPLVTCQRMRNVGYMWTEVRIWAENASKATYMIFNLNKLYRCNCKPNANYEKNSNKMREWVQRTAS